LATNHQQFGLVPLNLYSVTGASFVASSPSASRSWDGNWPAVFGGYQLLYHLVPELLFR